MASWRAERRRLAWPVALAAIALTPSAFAQTLADCARVDADAARLACYDRVAGRATVPASAPAVVPAPVIAPRPDVPAPSLPSAPAAVSVRAAPVSVADVPAAPAPSPAEPSVGLLPPRKPDPARIESRIAGHFEGWEGRTRFTLENGQVWENAGGGSVYLVAESPRVTITPGSFGSWFLSVEGSTARTAVRRLR